MDYLKFLDENIEEASLFLAREKGKKDRLEEELSRNKIELKELEEDIELLDKVNVLFQRTSEYAREQAKNQIESLVSNCLEFIFNEKVEFQIDIQESHGRASAKFFVVTEVDGKEMRLEPEHSKGGGVVDIVSLALRIAFLEINKPKIQGPLILDEPAKHVSNEYIYNVSEFLSKTSELFDRQIIMVTHNDFLASIGDKAYRVGIKDGQSMVEEIGD